MRRAKGGGCRGSLGRALSAAARATPVLLLTLPWLAHRLWAQTADEVQAAADGATRRLGLQTEFPRGPEPSSFSFSLPPEALWIVIAVAIAILLYLFRDTLMAWRIGGTGAWSEQEEENTAAGARDEVLVLEAADELAAAGRFVEAMHVLLLQGLAHIRRRLDRQFSDSLTSREILHGTNLPETARASLRDVVARVELTYFGKRPAALADYTACRESFNALTRALHEGAPG